MAPMSLGHHPSETGQVSPPRFKSDRQNIISATLLRAHIIRWLLICEDLNPRGTPGRKTRTNSDSFPEDGRFQEVLLLRCRQIKGKNKVKILSSYSQRVCPIPKPVFQAIFFLGLYFFVIHQCFLSAFYKCTHEIILFLFSLPDEVKGDNLTISPEEQL